jgi:hypothetical protein
MPLQNIPVLDANYPIFDWSEHQESRNALVPNNLVSDFTKETWNDIVDTLNNALLEAGLYWDSQYTTASGAKIYKPYGELTAKMFNSVRHNIDRPASIGWSWANNANFRGFVGREDFRGYRDYGKNCDFFYPEYILELVRKLNLLIGIMKDSANLTSLSFEDGLKTDVFSDLVGKKSAPITAEGFSKSILFNGIVGLLSFPIVINYNSKANIDADIRKPFGSLIQYKENVESNSFSDLRKNRIVGMGFQYKSNSVCDSFMIPRPFERFTKYSDLINSDSSANMAFWISLSMRIHSKSNSVSEANPFYLSPIPFLFFDGTKTIFDADIQPVSSYRMSGSSEKSTAKTESALFDAEPYRMNIADSASSNINSSVRRVQPKNAEGLYISKSPNSVELESAWYAPIWVDGKLYIQQTINNRHSGEILYIDETPELSVFVGQNSIYSAQIDTAWLPVSVDGNSIYIQQAFGVNEADDYLEVM